MRIASLCFVLSLGWLFADVARADQPYLFDLLKQKPYHAAWNAMLKGEKKLDPWVVAFGKTYDGVTDQIKTVTVDGETDTLGWVCKPHDCAGNELYVLFTPGGECRLGDARHGCPDAVVRQARRRGQGRAHRGGEGEVSWRLAPPT